MATDPTPEVPETPEDLRALADTLETYFHPIDPHYAELHRAGEGLRALAALLAAEDEHPATPEVVERAKALLAALPSSEWEHYGSGVEDQDEALICTPIDGSVTGNSPIAEFIAAAPELVADLLALVERPFHRQAALTADDQSLLVTLTDVATTFRVCGQVGPAETVVRAVSLIERLAAAPVDEHPPMSKVQNG